jgi:elongation factor P
MSEKLASELKLKDILIFDGKKCRVDELVHVKPGKGGTYVQLVLHDIKSHKKLETRIATSNKVSVIYIQKSEVSFLYNDRESFVFLNIHSNDEIILPISSFKREVSSFFPYSSKMEIHLDEDGECLLLEFRSHVTLSIKECPPYLKNASIKHPGKEVLLENNMKVFVPEYVQKDSKIIIDANTLKFISRSDKR